MLSSRLTFFNYPRQSQCRDTFCDIYPETLFNTFSLSCRWFFNEPSQLFLHHVPRWIILFTHPEQPIPHRPHTPTL